MYQTYRSFSGKSRLLEGTSTSFESGHKVSKEGAETEKNRIYQEIVKLKIELDWFKKIWTYLSKINRAEQEENQCPLPICKHCFYIGAE